MKKLLLITTLLLTINNANAITYMEYAYRNVHPELKPLMTGCLDEQSKMMKFVNTTFAKSSPKNIPAVKECICLNLIGTATVEKYYRIAVGMDFDSLMFHAMWMCSNIK